MRVLFINSVCGIRSTGRICTDLAEVLEKHGHECRIAYGRETVPEKYQKYAYRIGNDMSVRVDALKTRIFDNAGFNSTSATKKFIEWVKEYSPDIIHLHNIHGYYINIEILFGFLKEYNRPVFWTLHDCWSFTGHCAYFSAADCQSWKTGCLACPQRKDYPSSLLIDNSKNNYAQKKALFTSLDNLTLITPSKWLAGLVRESFLGKYPVKVIPNGIDLDVFKPSDSDFRKRYGLEDKKIILGVASVWDRRKGYYDFIRLSQMFDDNYKIVMVGLSEEQIRQLSDGVLGITKTNNVKELAQIYSAADVFVNTTYEDNYPTVNLEAQSCGIPVVTYKTGGSVESVPAENVVEQGDLSTLHEKVINSSRLRISNENFDKEAKYSEYMKLFGEKYENSFFD